jgi:formamidopyrimidine-DNA glycosylase
MIELPETHVLSAQLEEVVVGKTIATVTANASPHKFAWYSGNPEDYHSLLSGKTITGANPGTGYTCGGNTEILCEDMLLVISTPIKFHGEGDKLPTKHQLLIEFEDETYVSCTVQMWGAMFCVSTKNGKLPEDYKVNRTPDPLGEDFSEEYFERLLANTPATYSVKAFLATEQRIPGLGNGVLQDILFRAGIHPRHKLVNLGDPARRALYRSVRQTLRHMTAEGGRDTERDLFGCFGGYKTILSKKTMQSPCPVCGDTLVREAYLGGNIYFCPTCQPYSHPYSK